MRADYPDLDRPIQMKSWAMLPSAITGHVPVFAKWLKTSG